MSMADRNRKIKKLVSTAFAPYKVSVRGSRGTAYGWVSVKIDYAPRNQREAGELRNKVEALILAGGIDVGHYGYDDPGSDYGYGRRINVSFAQCRERAASYEDQWKQNLSAEDWDRMQLAAKEKLPPLE